MLAASLLLCALADAAAFSHPMHRGPHNPRLASSVLPKLVSRSVGLPRVGRMRAVPRLEAMDTAEQATLVRTTAGNENINIGNIPVAAEEGAVSREQFVFSKQWYPVAVTEFLDTRKPHPIQLMGKDLVTWYDVVTNKWNVFEDACPHRLAPLSEGRIEPDGTLLCTYHAW